MVTNLSRCVYFFISQFSLVPFGISVSSIDFKDIMDVDDRLYRWLLLLYLLGFGVIGTSLEPGFLDFDNLPDTNFTCVGKVIGGYYADLETSCQMFHVCTIGQLEEPMDIRFLCLNGTVFDQETRVCERIDEVDCTKSEQFYSLNLELYGNTQPPLVEDSAETEPPDYYKRSSTTTSSTTAIPHSTKARTTRQSFIITTSIKPTTTTTEPTIPKSNHITGTNAADIRFNPEEINISLNPGALPNIRTKQPISYQQTFSDNNKRLTVTTHSNIYKNEPIIHITSASPNIKVEVTQKYEDSQHHDTESQENYYHHSYNNDYAPEILKNHQYQYRHNVPNFRPSSRDVESYLPKEYKPSTFRSIYHPTTSPPLKHNYNNRGPTTYRNHGYSQQAKPSQQFYIRTEKPPRIQIPLPFLPTISPITFSSPAPFSLSKHTDVKRYSEHHHPRIVISASASVSDASGRKFNYSLGTIGDSRFFEPAPTSYDDYKEADVSLDPFYHDVPKLRRYKRNVIKRSIKSKPRSRRSTRSNGLSSILEEIQRSKRDTPQIFKDEKEAIDILRFLFEWYKINENEKQDNGKESDINEKIKYLQTLENSELKIFDESKKIMDQIKLNSEVNSKMNIEKHENLKELADDNGRKFVPSRKDNENEKEYHLVNREQGSNVDVDTNNNETFIIILKPNNEENLELEQKTPHNISDGVLSFNGEIPESDLTHKGNDHFNHTNQQNLENLNYSSVPAPQSADTFNSYDYVDDNYEPETYSDKLQTSTGTPQQPTTNNQKTLELATENYEKVLKILGVTTSKPNSIKDQATPNYYYEDLIKTTNDQFGYYDYPNYDYQPNLENRNFDLQSTDVPQFDPNKGIAKTEESIPTTTESFSTKFETPITVDEYYPTTKSSIYSEYTGNNVLRSKVQDINNEFSKVKSKSTNSFNSDHTPKPTKSSRSRGRGSKKFSLLYNDEYQRTTALTRRISTPQNADSPIKDLDDEASDFQPTTNFANYDFITESTEKFTPTAASDVEQTIPSFLNLDKSTTNMNYANDFLTTTVNRVIENDESSKGSIDVNEFESTIIIVPTTFSTIYESTAATPDVTTNDTNLEDIVGVTSSISSDSENNISTSQTEKSTAKLIEDNAGSITEVVESTDGLNLSTTTIEKDESSTVYSEETLLKTNPIPIISDEITTEIVENTTNLEYNNQNYVQESTSSTNPIEEYISSLVPEKLTTEQVKKSTPNPNYGIITELNTPTATDMTTTNIDNFITTMKTFKNSENKKKEPKFYENFSKEVVEAIKSKMTKFDKTNRTKNLSKNKIEFNINAYTANLAYKSRFDENSDPPFTDPPLSKSANPTLAKKPKDFLATTPLTKSITVNINRQHFNKTYRFNCFDKVINRFYSDPRDCRLFHYCTRGYTKTQLLDMKFVCDSGTFFDDVRLICTKDKPKRCL